MPSILNSPFEINGVISTDKTVVQNMNDIATAAGAWVTYDISQGKWAVVINQAGNSVASFTDSNIIGSINVSGTGVTELYNSAVIEFPHKDLRDKTDQLELKIDPADRFANEIDNPLTMRIDCINNPVQAQYLASVELKQSRVDKVIQFRTDYSKLGLKAGDLIDVTSEMYGYTNKVFRITTLSEDDSDGFLTLSITALEYDADVYDPTAGLTVAGLTRNERTRQTGIVPVYSNTSVSASNNAATSTSLTNSLTNPANAALAVSLLSAFSSNIGSGAGSVASLNTLSLAASVASVDSVYNTYAGTPSGLGPHNGNGAVYVSIPFSIGAAVRNLLFIISTPLAQYDFNFYDNSDSTIKSRTILAYAPSFIQVLYNGTVIQTNTVDWQTPNTTVQINNAAAGTYDFRFVPLETYDLNQSVSEKLYPYNFVTQAQASGGGITISAYAYYF